MKIATLGIIIQDEKLLLGEKKKGEIGIGKLSGPGGKLEPYEGLEECLFRETLEEFDVELKFPSLGGLRAIIDFYAADEIDFRVYVYLAGILSGEVHETDEMIPKWYPLDDLPFNEMYDADRHWLPPLLRGEKFNAKVRYKKRGEGFIGIEFSEFVFIPPTSLVH
ncbi:MAG: NUDIX domain-containing protein [bacterium]